MSYGPSILFFSKCSERLHNFPEVTQQLALPGFEPSLLLTAKPACSVVLFCFVLCHGEVFWLQAKKMALI